MFNVDVKSSIGDVGVKTTHNKGLSPEYWTERILERLVSVSDNADPMVKAQAEAFKEKVELDMDTARRLFTLESIISIKIYHIIF